MISIERLEEVLREYFGEPYLPVGLVRVKKLPMVDGKKRLSIFIGPRDIAINEDGEIDGAGTDVTTSVEWKGQVDG